MEFHPIQGGVEIYKYIGICSGKYGPLGSRLPFFINFSSHSFSDGEGGCALLNRQERGRACHAAKGNFFQKDAKLKIQKRSFSRFGTLVWNNIAPALPDKPKTVNRKTIRDSMLNLLSAEDDYVEINKIIDYLKSLA